MKKSSPPNPWRTPKRDQKEIGSTGVQNKCVEWARDNGWWARKFASPGNRSVPDCLFAKRTGQGSLKLAVEFKRPGKDPTEKQIEQHKLMRAAGWDVYVIDDVEEFKALFRSFEQQPDWLS